MSRHKDVTPVEPVALDKSGKLSVEKAAEPDKLECGKSGGDGDDAEK